MADREKACLRRARTAFGGACSALGYVVLYVTEGQMEVAQDQQYATRSLFDLAMWWSREAQKGEVAVTQAMELARALKLFCAPCSSVPEETLCEACCSALGRIQLALDVAYAEGRTCAEKLSE